jgi:hypothetical protein
VADGPEGFDPYGLLRALDQRRATYIVIGGFARVIQGTEEITHGLDIVPSTRPENLRRFEAALNDVGARRADGRELTVDEHTLKSEHVLELVTQHGELKVVAEPTGTRGYEDARPWRSPVCCLNWRSRSYGLRAG